MIPSDQRQAAIAQAVRGILEDLRRQVAPSVVEARAVERLMRLFEPAERPDERIARENAEALREMAALGNTRDAAMQVARRRTADPHAREVFAQRLRRLRRKKRALCE